MTHPVRVRESLAGSRDAGWSFAEAWAVVQDEDPLENFMEGYFPEGRDSEGGDFAKWCENLWRDAFHCKPPGRKQKPTRLNPYRESSTGLRGAYTASQDHTNGRHATSSGRDCQVRGAGGDGAANNSAGDLDAHPRAAEHSQPARHFSRCKFGTRCERPATHGRLRHFCADHHAKLRPIIEAFERDEALRSELLATNRAVTP